MKRLCVCGGIPVLLALILSACIGPEPYQPMPIFKFTSVSPSATGDRIVFGFDDRSGGERSRRLGIVDVKSGMVHLIPQPEKRDWSSPVFSPDGKSIAFAAFCFYACTKEEFGYHLATLNLRTREYKQITENGRQEIRFYPSYSPDGKRIYFVSADVEWNKEGGSRPRDFFGLSSVRLADGREDLLLPNDDALTRFQYIGQPTALANGDVLFSAMAPSSDDVDEGLRERGRKLADHLTYRLGPDGTLAFVEPLSSCSTKGASASENGHRIAFVANFEDPKITYGLEQEIYVFQDNAVQRRSHMETEISSLEISSDGSVVAVISGKSVPTREERATIVGAISLLDLNSGEVREILSVDRLRAALERDKAAGSFIGDQ